MKDISCALPITVIDTPSKAPPCHLYVEDTPIDEAAIAREMPFHRAASPERSRADAARALVIRELLRRETLRLDCPTHPSGEGRCIDEESRIQALIEHSLKDRTPSEAECRRYFENNRDRLRAPDRMRVRHILLASPTDDVKGRHAARSQAERLIAELKDQMHRFSDLAARHSDCPSRNDGGDLGWLQRGQTTPEFDRQLFRLRPGMANFPVESRWGHHVVLVDEYENGMALDFDQARVRISDYLELQARQRDLHHFLLELRCRYTVRGLEEIESQSRDI